MSRRLFVNEPEVNFFNDIGKELIQEIVGQKLIYYAVSNELTKSDDLYNEATKKVLFHPIEINALVLYRDPVQTVTSFSADTVYSIEIYFLLYELTERDVTPRMGDFVQFGKDFYEIEQLTLPQLTYGQIDHKVQVRATCRIAREGQFKVLPMKDSV